MIYRFCVVWPNKELHKRLMSKRTKIGALIFQQILAIFFATLIYTALVKPRVSELYD
jgi:hypothetical protein